MANERARRLRSNLTDAEKKLWWRLRALKREGFHFRRQVPINHLIVDFACYSARLVVEVDGGHHNWDESARRDRARDAHLRSQGFRTPTPNPSPQGRGYRI
jgi:very-short-patch-repair endonuclease